MPLSPVYPLTHMPLLGRGVILLDVHDDDGNRTGYVPVGNVPQFGFSNSDEKAELYGSMQQSTVKIAETTKKRNLTLKLQGTDFGAQNLVVGMLGEKASYSQAATAVTDETLAAATVTKKGKYFRTAKRKIGTVTVKSDSTTLTATTDYVIADAESGLIYFPTTSSVDDAKIVTVSYTPTAISDMVTIKAFTKGKIEGTILFIPDPADGPKIEVEVWKVSLTPDGEIGLISDEYGNWTLSGAVLDDSANHADNPYFEMRYL